MSQFWREFFDNYRRCEATSEDDLFFQVGKTIGKQPIPSDTFIASINRIVAQLELSTQDHLFEFCCGNGLVTYELASRAGRITAVDFVERYIQTARKLKSRANIEYKIGDALAPLSSVLQQAEVPDKYLMNVALAYFAPPDLGMILDHIKSHQQLSPFRFLITDIPNIDLKWNFYNTPERRTRHLANESIPGNSNDGLGRWWSVDEIVELCRYQGLSVQLVNQPPELSTYRMDALVSSPPGTT